MKKIKKGKQPIFIQEIKKSTVYSREKIRFSFELFDNSDCEICPPNFREGYTQALMERLKNLSSWRMVDFASPSSVHSLKNHIIDFDKTSRTKGFQHLNSNLQEHEAWQFSISKNERGRVHGIIISDVFYIIWLDQDHILYEAKNV